MAYLESNNDGSLTLVQNEMIVIQQINFGLKTKIKQVQQSE